MGSKAKILIKGSLLRTTYFILNVLVGLFLMPFMIHSLGDELYGLWMLMFSLLGFYLIFDMGLSSATQRFVSKAIGEEDYKEANVIANTSFFMFVTIGIVVLLILFVSAYLLPSILKNIANIHLFRIVMIILGVNLAVSIPMKVFSGILSSHLRFDIQTGIELLKLCLRTALIVLSLKFGYGVISLALIFCLVDFFGYLLLYLFVKQEATYFSISGRFFEKNRIKKLYSYSWKTFIAQLADRLRFNIDNFVIVTFLGLNFVTIYSIASRLIFHFMNLNLSVVGTLSPLFSQYEGRGDFNSIKNKFIFTTKISSYLAIFIGVCFILFGKLFIERWLGASYLNAYPLLVVLTICMTTDLMQHPSVQLFYGVSEHKFYAISNLIEGAANLIISVVLVRKFGLMGVALGTAIPMVIFRLFIQPAFVCKIVKISTFHYYFKIIGPVLSKSLALVGGFYLVARQLFYPTYSSIIYMAAIVLILFLIMVFLIGFDKNEMNYLKSLLVNSS